MRLLPTNPDKRRDLANEAIVNAALRLRDKVGHDVTYEFLIDAGLRVEVVERVLNGGPMRSRP